MSHRALRFTPACLLGLLYLGCTNPSPAPTTPEANATPSSASQTSPAANTTTQPQQYEVRIEMFTERQTAVVRETAHHKNIGPKIMGATGVVYQALEVAQAPKTGPNIVLYYNDSTQGSWTEPPGIPIEVGVMLLEPTPALSPPVVRSSLPGGRVAATTHFGRYQALEAAHKAVQDYCAANGLTIALRTWEVYGPWMDNPAERRTDVYYLLK